MATALIASGCQKEDTLPSPAPEIGTEKENEEDDGKGPEPGMIWDFTNWSVEVNVTDESGNDVLSGSLATGSVVSYKDQAYPAKMITRAYLPTWDGLVLYEKGDLNALIFGEFGPDQEYKKEPLTLTLGDGTKLDLAFDLYITWKNYEPTVHKRNYLDGEQVTDWQTVGKYRVLVTMGVGKSLTGW